MKWLPQWTQDSVPLFPSFTGCDRPTVFAGREKKLPGRLGWLFQRWLTHAMNSGQGMFSKVNEESISLLERFVVLMYDRASDSIDVDDARKQLFTYKSRTLANVPPIQEAHKQHIKRTYYHAANCWNQALVLDPKVLDPSDWGWMKETTGW